MRRPELRVRKRSLYTERHDVVVILIVLKDAHEAAMVNAAQQVKARGARLIVITDDPSLCNGIADEVGT